ncbi:hypothetical protein BJD49_gp095 [Acinetobacter phage vB_AbaM_phiAbaA1]|uniref:hypothetical protein n=1 Tax=Acinetobacter phage vB_AbaM_phiAbaA1 TaxID=1605379 RepID=UPI00078E25BA|nr:hypothetical protein BJD49_gp095 [Acinetobacter phage vB_AbaM_phiAbaA1]AJK27195.1 hypothetical protein phiAbaA1_092 [Acinetobacter phage vB_AbaM_phiAbaA1]
MGKASRLKRQRKAQREQKQQAATIAPIPLEDVLNGQMGRSYWVTGYYWEHDVKIVEPFCVVCMFKKLEISNLDSRDIEYYEAKKLLLEPQKLFILEDRVEALNVCQMLNDEKELLDGMSSFMSENDFKEFANSRIEG